MGSTDNEGKLLHAETFIRALQVKSMKKRQLIIKNLILVIWIN